MGALAAPRVRENIPGTHRSPQRTRTQDQLISSSALFDETPEVSIATGAVNTAWLIRAQTVFSNAIAICGGARLGILRAFDKKVLDLATQSLAPDSGLRAVHTQELLQADRKIWSELAALHAEGWSLDKHCARSPKSGQTCAHCSSLERSLSSCKEKEDKAWEKRGKTARASSASSPLFLRFPTIHA